MSTDFDKKILITGVTRGLGYAMVEKFSENGHLVLGCGRSSEAIAAMNTRWPSHDFCPIDVSKEKQVEAWANRLIDQYGPPDFILNNAALINRNSPLWEISAQEFNQIISVNIIGVTNIIRSFLPAMIEKQKGIIVNFSSGWGRSTAPEVAPYCASKWAIEGLTRALAQELPGNMAAVALNPGIIHTKMLESCFGDQARYYPFPDEWAERAVPFILKMTARDNGKAATVC